MSFSWMFSGVYGLVVSANRNTMWGELAAVQDEWKLPWCIAGDFNIVRFPSEKWRGGSLTRQMKCFSDFVEGHELVDYPLEGAKLTWSNRQEELAMSKLDRFLVSSS